MKKLFKYIRFRICRSIYYADWCPTDYRKNYKQIVLNACACVGLVLTAVTIFVLLAMMC